MTEEFQKYLWTLEEINIFGDDGNDIRGKVGKMYTVYIDNDVIIHIKDTNTVFDEDWLPDHYEYYPMMGKDSPDVGDILPQNKDDFLCFADKIPN